MTTVSCDSLLAVRLPFAGEGGRRVPVTPVLESSFADWVARQGPAIRMQIAECGFSPKPGKVLLLRDGEGRAARLLLGIGDPVRLYDFSAVAELAARSFSKESLETTTFFIDEDLSPEAATTAALGWCLAAYDFSFYKTEIKAPARLAWPETADRRAVEALVSGITLTRHLINMPAADMGPQEMEAVARRLAQMCDAEIAVTLDEESLMSGFPMLHAVGKGSPRRPCLIDLRRRRAGAPRVALVGKGICFDTGGLDIKPGAAMSLMKKDMGGAAHALGLFRILCTLDLPLDLRVLVPAAENAVSGEAFRPRDILRSRKGLTVEVLDTDAEGRLVLGDALTFACEDRPDLVVDFATLTGAARTALGFDVPALFASRDATAQGLQAQAAALDDPMWRLPLWRPYARELEGEISDLVNIGSGPAGCITAALFLEKFIAPSTDWLHLDLYAWEQTGRPGRPKGGAEMGLRALTAYLSARFCPPSS